MKRSTWIKRAVATFLVVLMSIESFAAVVGDNDGAAFITKAEFESLKNEFQNQINRYNSSLDNKIDGAIANYLSGVRVSKKTSIKALVASFSDLLWCHDFSLVSIKRTWSAKTTATNDPPAVVQPDYTNRVGWTFYMNNRGIRTYVEDQNLWGLASFPMRFNFASDNDGPTRTSGRQLNDMGNGAISLNLDDKNVIVEDQPIVRFNRVFYLWKRFGLISFGRGGSVGDGVIFHTNEYAIGDPRNPTILIEPVRPYEDDYVTLHMWIIDYVPSTGAISKNYWQRYSWNKENSEIAPVGWTDYNTNNDISESSERATYPLYSYTGPSVAQVNADKNRIVFGMIGGISNYKMPMLFDMKLGGRTGQVAGRFYPEGSPSEIGLSSNGYWFPDWSQWDKKSVECTLSFPDSFTNITKFTSDTEQGGWDVKTWPIDLYDSTKNKVTVQIPVLTLFKLNIAKSPVAIYNNQNLSICGGIPILADAQEKAKLEVKIKCEKKYDDVTETNDPANCDAHIKFKKSDFTNNKTDYCTGTYTGQSSNVTFNDALTIDVSDKTFSIDVDKNDTIWLNIDPITLGQHIRIKEMTVTLITE